MQAVQQRLEESRRANREKDALVAKLRTRLRQLEVAAQNACKEREDEEAHRKQEHKMLLDVSSAPPAGDSWWYCLWAALHCDNMQEGMVLQLQPLSF